MYVEIHDWIEKLLDFKIPRWEDLPHFELYSDQVVQLIHEYVKDVVDEENVITPSMINNYVKLKIMPKPVKKRYTKVHLAHLLAITLLKQIIVIDDIGHGILYQSETSGGLKPAYNIFAEEVEKSVHNIALEMLGRTSEIDTFVTDEGQAMHFAADAFAGKIVAKKILKTNLLKREADSNERKSSNRH